MSSLEQLTNWIATEQYEKVYEDIGHGDLQEEFIAEIRLACLSSSALLRAEPKINHLYELISLLEE